MTIDFDQQWNRLNTNSVKWDAIQTLFGGDDLIPMWVADMDFQSPPAILEALQERAKLGIYGYTVRPQSYFDAVTGWLQRRHGWEIKQEWLSTSPSVLTALSILLSIMTEPGDGVIIQTPVYNAFVNMIPANERTIVENLLIERDGRFEMDFADLEQKLQAGAKVMLLCSPHNPVGRVWKAEELVQVGELCAKYNVPVISDEIHFDLVYPGQKHTMFGSLSEAFAQNSVTLFSPTKTFNLAGLHTSSVLIPNDSLRRRFNQKLNALNLSHESYFGLVALETAYTQGEVWLDQLMHYIEGNLDVLNRFAEQHLPGIKVIQPEGTYLVWLDCRELGMNRKQIQDWMFKEAKVALSEGSQFGERGEGFLRMNIACPRATLEEGLNRLKHALPSVKHHI